MARLGLARLGSLVLFGKKGKSERKRCDCLLLVEDTQSVTKNGMTLFPDPHSQSDHSTIKERAHDYCVNWMTTVEVLDDDV